MKRIMVMAVLVAALSCAAVTVAFRDGREIRGAEVISQDDTNVVLCTDAGVVTAAWKAVTVETVQALNPELYARLQTEVDEQAKEAARKLDEAMQAQGKVLWEGTWMPRDEVSRLKLSQIRLKVDVDEKSRNIGVSDSRTGDYWNKTRTNSKTTKYWYEVKVQMAGLARAAVYRLRCEITQELSIDANSSVTVAATNGVAVTGETDWSEIFAGTAYSREVATTRTTIVIEERGAEFKDYFKSRKTTGMKSKRIAVRLWLDDRLVYEMKDKDKPMYYTVSEW